MAGERVPPTDGVIKRGTLFREVPPTGSVDIAVVSVSLWFDMLADDLEQIWEVLCNSPRVVCRDQVGLQPKLALLLVAAKP